MKERPPNQDGCLKREAVALRGTVDKGSGHEDVRSSKNRLAQEKRLQKKLCQEHRNHAICIRVASRSRHATILMSTRDELGGICMVAFMIIQE
jgi:hypothetical protein